MVNQEWQRQARNANGEWVRITDGKLRILMANDEYQQEIQNTICRSGILMAIEEYSLQIKNVHCTSGILTVSQVLSCKGGISLVKKEC